MPRASSTLRASLLLATAATSLAACGERSDVWETPLQIHGPHAAGEQLLWLDGTRGLLFALEPSRESDRVHVASIGRNITFAQVTGEGSDAQLLVLTAGREPERAGETAEDPALTAIRPRAGRAPQIRTYALPAAFDRVVASDDGTVALAHFVEGGDSSGTGQVFRNPNQLAIVDLTADAAEGDNPRLRTLRSFGSAPLAALISPPLAIGEAAARPVGVVIARGYITLLDLQHRDRREITVRLGAEASDGDASQQVIARQVLFAADPATLLVRADGADDIFALDLVPRTPDGDGDNDFRPQIQQPSAGSAVRDMLIVPHDERTLVLTANAGRKLALIDSATSEASRVALDAAVDTLVGVPAEDPTMALAFSRETPHNSVQLVDLAQLQESGTGAVTTRALSQPVHDIVPTPDERQALIVHDDRRTVISLLDLADENHTDTPIEGQLPLESFDFAGDTHLVGVSAGLQRLGLLELSRLQPADLRLDYAPRKVVTLGEQIVVDHGAPHGLVTLLPKPTAPYEQARVLAGFLLQDLLDQELRE